MIKSTDTRGVAKLLCAAILAMAGSGCATMSGVADTGYDQSMAAAELAMRGDDALAAVQAYRRAAEAAPSVMLPWLEIAEIQAGLGDWPQAVSASQEVLNREPDNAVARDFYLRGSLQLAIDALGYLPVDTLTGDDPNHELASDLAARLIDTLGDDAVPADTRARLEAGAETRLRRSGPRPVPSRSTPKAVDKSSADPLDVLGGG